jgi:hypothetical protein
MASIKVTLKDGKVLDFPHVGRAGGSYTKTIRYEGGFAIIKDEYYNETAIPSENIARVDVKPERY